MRIGCLQFAPVRGDVNNNLSRADAVLLKDNPEDLDVLVLPELAFTGYNFKSLAEIFPHLEPTGSGTSSLWARTVALKYDCTVVVGYPEKVDVSQKWPASPEYYNSAIIVDGEGQTVASYRKSHLTTDETWALEGQGGFFNGDIAGVKNVTIGISTDIAPSRFDSLPGSFEFASHVLQVRSNLVIVSLACPTNQEGRLFSRSPHEPDMDTLMHWVSRLEPIINRDSEEEVVVVFANRTGTEEDVVYAGTSAILGLKNGEVNVYGILGRSDRELLVVDTDKEPWGKLVYRPRADSAPSAHPQRFYDDTAIPASPAPFPNTHAQAEKPVAPFGVSTISEVLRADNLPQTPPYAVLPASPPHCSAHRVLD
ncbi:related to amino-terminal amidase [Cephalotrichum gorgonifer]|uniref:Related to amino-terminal amidase n=1 Tax=Cephalotrichum gorgonifer TaxID=2041049 RepID=A0AAE8SSY2_9PEZI|nr:related to amino-terminal amidase [Cephalotrichum gorgonifer]